MGYNDFSPEVLGLAEKVQAMLDVKFAEIDRTAEINTARVLDAFREARVEEACFAGTTGYGYDDMGRETLDKIYARVFGAESALVRTGFVNGTHAIASMLYGTLRPGDTLLSATDAPYDTLRTVIGISGNEPGSLREYGISYAQTDLRPDGTPDFEAITRAVKDPKVTAVLVQRSRGYSSRPALTVQQIGKIADAVHSAAPDTAVLVDNCYGEFTDIIEPTELGADLMAGSLIKNPGGGLAPTGGYIAGKRELVERAAARLTVPGIGGECGATLGTNRQLFQGFFMAPHIVAQALKTAVFCAGMLTELGFTTSPGPLDRRSDIIQTVELKTPENLRRFCKGIQQGSPVDSFVTPEPWNMPGYESEVIMAAGAFIQGSSIELSCDGPMREPYMAFIQGGLTYESGKLGIMRAVNEMLDKA